MLFNKEISNEDLIGYYQPKTPGKGEIFEKHKLSSLINWNKGPIYKSLENGIPIILDDIGYAKSQILESMNSILETNVKYDELSYKVVQNKGDILKIKKGSKFVIIGTIKQEHLNNISKALLNRFVVIYVDEKRITENNIDLNMIDKIIQNLNLRLKKI